MLRTICNIFLKIVLCLVILAFMFTFNYWMFQFDSGPPLGQLKISKPIPVMTPQDICNKKVADAEMRFQLSASADNWQKWSKALKECHVTP